MKAFKRIFAVVLACAMVFAVSAPALAGSPSSSTWWPPGMSLLDSEDDHVEGNYIEQEDQDILGSGFLATDADCMPWSERYTETQQKFVAVLKEEGYNITKDTRVMPIAAANLKAKEGSTGPYKINFSMSGNPTVLDDLEMIPIENIVLNQWIKSPRVYALHHTGAKGWEVLKSSELTEVPYGDGYSEFTGTITSNSLSPFYFFMVMSITTKESVDLMVAEESPEAGDGGNGMFLWTGVLAAAACGALAVKTVRRRKVN